MKIVAVNSVRVGKQLGFASHNRFIYKACEVCGKPRWVMLYKYNKGLFRLCTKCFGKKQIIKINACNKGENHPSWHGGRHRTPDGYITLWVNPDDFFYSMANKRNSQVREHRLVMAKHLGRCLTKEEIVHHKNGIKDDNRIENLYLTIREKHKLSFGDAFQDGYNLGYSKGYEDGRFEQVVKRGELSES